jgi:hypothetical protein
MRQAFKNVEMRLVKTLACISDGVTFLRRYLLIVQITSAFGLDGRKQSRPAEFIGGADRINVCRKHPTTAFRAEAKKLHSDLGGSDDAMAELNAARARLKELAA